uniref:Putative ovule protein n=1 Tax=Solanum chacoense TaxID=4108 RepID=A0A0V0GSY6_SOLCH
MQMKKAPDGGSHIHTQPTHTSYIIFKLGRRLVFSKQYYLCTVPKFEESTSLKCSNKHSSSQKEKKKMKKV